MSSRSVGVEEEFLLVEPGTGRLKAVAGTVLQTAGQAAGSDLEAELQQQQLEANSRPCHSLDDLHRELRRCRASAAAAAGRAGAQVAALGASFQRAAYRRSGRLPEVIGAAVLATETG